MPQNFTYDQIKPLIVSEEQNGMSMVVEFALPGSDETHSASGSIRRSNSTGSRVTQQVKRSMANEVRRTLSRTLRGIFGGGFLGRTASQVANTTTSQTGRDFANQPSAADKEAAVVAAFARVARHFSFDEGTGSWSKAGAPAAKAEPSGFAKQLADSPVNGKFERNVLARVMAAIAYADGDLADEEKEFFQSSIPAEVGTLEELAQADPVSAVEAEEVPAAVRETIYMLGWTICVVDMEAADVEVKLLREFGDKFAISGDRQDELERFAKIHVLEGYLSPDMERSELFEYADQLSLAREDAERAKIAWMRRN